MISKSINIANKYGTAVPVINHVDSTYISQDSYTLFKQIDRNKLLSSQTPQAYKTKILYDAIEYAERNRIEFKYNDVAEFILETGRNPYVFKGSKYNIKLTSNEDILLLKSIHQILNTND